MSGRLWRWLLAHQPREGWLAVLLLATTVIIGLLGVREVGWVPEDNAIFVTGGGGFLLAAVLAKQPLRPRRVWMWLTIYGLLIPLLTLARLGYGPALWGQPWSTVRQTWLNNGALFIDRVAGWTTAVFGGGRSEETIVFALGLALLAWFASAYLAWTSFRQGQPLRGLTLMGLALALNSYYGRAPVHWMAIFMTLAAAITAVLHYTNLETDWNQRGLDYATDIRLELSLYAGGISVALLSLSLLLPAIPYTDMANDILVFIGARQAEEAMERAFAGVEQPRGVSPGAPGGVGGSGTLPRGYLLSGDPALLETVVMTATVTLPDGAAPDLALLRGVHWRGLSYVIYTGRGWTLSPEREEDVAAGQPIALPPQSAQQPLQQTVHWQFDERFLRYTLGLPLQFDQDVVVAWRGVEDLSRVLAKSDGDADTNQRYQVTSRVPVAEPSTLRQRDVTDVSPAILARYTQLPEDLPPRIGELAREVVAGIDNPYDQARALEQFLRRYPYSLDISAPPADVDVVDYFLFELQTGYCDYYASSMVVMARTLGLPARIAIGYLAQPSDDNGVQTVRHENGHSWAEIYFAGVGWVEFEPTAPFVSGHEETEAAETAVSPDAVYEPPYPDVPLPPPDVPLWRRLPWGRLAILAGLTLALLAAWLWQSRRPRLAAENALVAAYGRLLQQARALDAPLAPGQTPAEFSQRLTVRLRAWAETQWIGQRWVQRLVTAVVAPNDKLTAAYTTYRYSQRKTDAATADDTYRQTIDRPLIWLRLLRRLQRR